MAAKKRIRMAPGERNGRLVSVKRIDGNFWLFRCDCGNEKPMMVSSVRSGNSRSCGCLANELTSKRNKKLKTTHGKRHAPEYGVWLGMRARCNSVASKDFPKYGGRGISVCERWNKSFENFYADMGKRPTSKHSIDRINNDGNYEPSNARWATIRQQQRNKRGLHLIRVGDVGVCMQEAAELSGVNAFALQARISKYGWTTERAISTPVRRYKKPAT